MSRSSAADVLVVGGGVIGLAAAWRLRQRGMSVMLLERGELGGGTSRVAAGMLAPTAEVEFGADGRRALALALRSAELWPAFAEELQDVSGRDVGLLRTGTLLIARDDDDVRELERALSFREGLGLPVERLRHSAVRDLEPALAPTIRMALRVPEDHSVEPRAVLAALAEACRRAGVALRERVSVTKLEVSERGVCGVRLQDGTLVEGGHVVLAAGPWSAGIDCAGAVPVPLRPVRGQILRLRDPAGPGLLHAVARFRGGYLVPRADGRYVLGASVEERGFDPAPTAGAVYELLRDAGELLPGISELEIEELSVGFRPATPDNGPAIGAGSLDGLTWAVGHHRNGILLAPLTAELVAGQLIGEEQPTELLEACSPGRFEPARASSSNEGRAGIAARATAEALAR